MAHTYSNTAGAMTLTGGVGAANTSITLDTVVGLPVAFPYSLTLDYGLSSEEVVDVTAAAGTTLTITRGVDGTSAQSHSAGAPVRHVAVARDFRESQQHIDATSGVHGVTGPLVGTTDTQTLELKTFQSSVNTDTALTVKAKAGQTAALFRILDSTGAALWAVDGTTINSDASVIRTSAGASFWGQVAKFTAPLGRKALELIANAGEAAGTKVFQVYKGATSIFSVAANGDVDTSGKITAANTLTVTGGGGTINGGLTLTGPLAVTGTTDVLGSATVSGALTVASRDVVTTNTAGGKRLVFNSTAVTTDASGNATVTHGAGFTPSAVFVSNLSGSTGSLAVTAVDTYTPTTFRIRVYLVNGGSPYAGAINIAFLAVN